MHIIHFVVVIQFVVYNTNEVILMLTDKLKELRLSYGFKQSELADKLSISTSRYGQYERGDRMPDYNMLVKIADIYNISLDYLLGRNIQKIDEIDPFIKKIIKSDSETKASVEQFLNYLLYEKERKNKEKNDNNIKKNTDNEIAI